MLMKQLTGGTVGGALNFQKGQISISTTKETYPLDFKPKMVAITAKNSGSSGAVGVWFYDMDDNTPKLAYRTTSDFTVGGIAQWDCEMELLDNGFAFKLGSTVSSWAGSAYYVAVG